MAEKVSAKTAWALAKAIKGAASSSGGSSTQTATFIRKDTDGTCWVRFAGNDFDTPVNGQTLADAEPGQTVQCSIDGTSLSMVGNASDPAVGGKSVSKTVERVRKTLSRSVESAQRVADAAQAVAEAVNQHFFADDGGIHVTEATQEDWNESHTGANVLINSIGQLFRDGLNNLLTLTTESGARALTIWDGLGNAAENVVATFDGDGIGLVGGAFRLTSERVTEEYGDENNPTTMTEIRSIMKSEGGNDNYETRCFLRSMVGEDDDAYYNSIELTSETDIKTQSPTETNNASVEVGSDQWGSSVRLVADSQELHLYKHPVDGKDYFNLNSEVFMITDYHNGVNMWSTVHGTVLWSGAYYMTANHTANLAYNISTCPTGVVLHFQPYTPGTAQNYFHQYCFVPKTTVTASAGAVHNFTLCNSGFAKVGIKAMRIYDNRIVGDDTNDDTGTASGITFDNKYWVMTQVIAV